MIFEIKFLGIRVVLDPEMVEALLDFVATMLDLHRAEEESASSKNKALE